MVNVRPLVISVTSMTSSAPLTGSNGSPGQCRPNRQVHGPSQAGDASCAHGVGDSGQHRQQVGPVNLSVRDSTAFIACGQVWQRKVTNQIRFALKRRAPSIIGLSRADQIGGPISSDVTLGLRKRRGFRNEEPPSVGRAWERQGLRRRAVRPCRAETRLPIPSFWPPPALGSISVQRCYQAAVGPASGQAAPPAESLMPGNRGPMFPPGVNRRTRPRERYGPAVGLLRPEPVS